MAGLSWGVGSPELQQPDGSVYRAGKCRKMVCPPQQILILLVSQRFSYPLLLKSVP